MLKGLDISYYQGALNFDNLKNDFNFIIAKATEGNGLIDPQFKRNQSEGRRVGILMAYYHFARPHLGNTAQAEADFFLNTVGKLNEGEILCLDYEDSYTGDVVTWCKTFLDRVLVMTGIHPIIYLNQNLAKSFVWKSVIDGNYGLWLADYDYDPNTGVPQTQWSTVAIKQYSNKLPYSNVTCDADVFYGDANTFKAYGYKLTNSDPTMTQEETNILNFVRANNITEGQVRQGYDYVKMGTVDQLNTKVQQLADEVAANLKSAQDWQTKAETANNSITQLQEDNKTLSARIDQMQLNFDNFKKQSVFSFIKLKLGL